MQRSGDNSPRVSIVVPIYNAAKFLDATVDSLLKQVYPNVEIVAIDDGSTDESARILAAYADRVNILTQVNSGQAAAINRGWDACSGDYLGYLSADDVLKPECVAEMVRALDENDARIASYPAFDLMDHNGKCISKFRGGVFSRDRAITELDCPVGPGLLFRRSALQKIGGWDLQFQQIPDIEFLIRLSMLGSVHYVPKSLSSFRVHPQSQSFAPATLEKSQEPIVLYNKLSAAGLLEPAFAAEAHAFAYTVAARLHIRSGRRLIGGRHVLQAVHLYPPILGIPKFYRLLINGVLGRIKHQLAVKWKARA